MKDDDGIHGHGVDCWMVWLVLRNYWEGIEFEQLPAFVSTASTGNPSQIIFVTRGKHWSPRVGLAGRSNRSNTLVEVTNLRFSPKGDKSEG